MKTIIKLFILVLLPSIIHGQSLYTVNIVTKDHYLYEIVAVDESRVRGWSEIIIIPNLKDPKGTPINLYEGNRSKKAYFGGISSGSGGYQGSDRDVRTVDVINGICVLRNGWRGNCDKRAINIPNNVDIYIRDFITETEFGEEVRSRRVRKLATINSSDIWMIGYYIDSTLHGKMNIIGGTLTDGTEVPLSSRTTNIRRGNESLRVYRWKVSFNH